MDMSEDLSESEKGDNAEELSQCEIPRVKFQRNFSDLQVWSDDNKEKKLYIVLIRYMFFYNVHKSFIKLTFNRFFCNQEVADIYIWMNNS